MSEILSSLHSDGLLSDISEATGYTRMIFNVACLYAFVVFLFGLLSLQTSKQQERSAQWQQYYGSPETAFQLTKQQQLIQQKKAAMGQDLSNDDNRITRSFDFLYYFFIRPSVIIGSFFAITILRHHKDAVISEILSYGLSAGILASWGNYPTKFIPGMTAAIGFTYGTLHMLNADHLISF
jgi:hypothetical protein